MTLHYYIIQKLKHDMVWICVCVTMTPQVQRPPPPQVPRRPPGPGLGGRRPTVHGYQACGGTGRALDHHGPGLSRAIQGPGLSRALTNGLEHLGDVKQLVGQYLVDFQILLGGFERIQPVPGDI